TEVAKEIEGCVVASGAALERAGDEADRWRVVGTRSLRGSDEDTEIAVPREHADARTVGPGSDGEDSEEHAEEPADSERRAPSLG
ncbi:MAG TPA: hypothetical protein VNP37_03640, partial [Actinomycetospora sp.]|nr:hypothetical protein [Actinomycetospora sp.]